MPMLKILAVAIGMTLGSLLMAIFLSSLAWWFATRIHHPRWGASFLLIIIGGAWLASLGHSEFVKMATVFGLVASGLLYFVGREEQGRDPSGDAKIGGCATSGSRQ